MVIGKGQIYTNMIDTQLNPNMQNEEILCIWKFNVGIWHIEQTFAIMEKQPRLHGSLAGSDF